MRSHRLFERVGVTRVYTPVCVLASPIGALAVSWPLDEGGLVYVRALLYLDNKAYFPFDLPDWPLVPETGFQSVSG